LNHRVLGMRAVFARPFVRTGRTYLSIDAEGLHLAILKKIDYTRFRPKVICVETLVAGTNREIPETTRFMKRVNYVARGATFVNTIFIDGRLL